MLMTKKDDTTTHGRRRFLHLLVSNQSAAHGISHLHFLLLLLSLSVPLVSAQPSSENDQQPYRNFNPSMAIIIIVLISAFFFMGFFSIYIRQCAEDRNGGSIRPANMVGRSRRAARGLDPAVIETFPTFMYSVVKGLQLGKGALECAVCLNEFEDDETLRLLPKCDHVFHPECIDAWLSSHTTCPVCRANLVPGSGEDAAALEQVPDDTNGESDVENPRPEVREDQSQGGSLHVIEEQNTEQQAAPDVISPCQVPIQNRPPRAKSSRRPRYTGKFPRSHSTGHSLVQPGENCDRFTLRLPEEVRKQIMKGRLNRTTSCVAFPTEGSTRRGYRSGGEGSSRGKSYNNNNTTSQLVGGMDRSAKSDRWVFSMTPPFFTRTFSTRSAKAGADGEAATTPKAFFTSVKTPFDCLGGKPEGAESSSTRPPV